MDEELLTHGRSADRKSGNARVFIGAALGAFLLGGFATWYFGGSPGLSTSDLFVFRKEQPVAAIQGAPTRDQAASQAISSDYAADGRMDQRVAAMEQRLTEIDLQSQEAAGNAARAEGLLIAFATRRAIERGTPLGYLSDQLQVRFGEAQPQAVQTIIAASRNPITLDQLLARLDGLAPQLTQAPQSEGAFSWLSRELSELFVVRREDSPSPAPVQRLERARLFLQSGRTEAAISEVRNLPSAGEASGWIADAQRFAATQQALEALEAAAILEPRELRDGTGKPVDQPSPVVVR
ncbi:hypothetical protein [Altererythrobacter sp. Root672]|uniref:hypothetical protein n=1 Tax=Altererythrobacter sp. Root672 TaxID=1736584 RepID=UPI0006FCCA06|nr:hypothetical protein [Altererythrobacter sp. Root672]KRA82759.1 hypothetical protein ASD76_01320 [Altererythrobacter sp. Root672]